METKEVEQITEEFFRRRFPDKDIVFEKKCGYFYEWMTRFKTGNASEYMDDLSLEVWQEMQEEQRKKDLVEDN